MQSSPIATEPYRLQQQFPPAVPQHWSVVGRQQVPWAQQLVFLGAQQPSLWSPLQQFGGQISLMFMIDVFALRTIDLPKRRRDRSTSSTSRYMKIFHLANCTTCQRILKEITKLDRFGLQEINTEPITAKQLDELKEMAGSYDALFSRKAMKYRSMGLHERELSEKEMRDLILQEYTFLKRPVIVIGDRIFIGNAPRTVKAMLEAG